MSDDDVDSAVAVAVAVFPATVTISVIIRHEENTSKWLMNEVYIVRK